MKRTIVYALAATLLAACSTQEKDFRTLAQDDAVFYASFEQPGDEGTRVYANEDLLLRWTADDRVSIFNKLTYNQEYKFTGKTGANAGGFKKVDNDEFVTGNAIPHVVSVYPYQEATEITEEEVLSVTLPAEQTYAGNTFGLGANTMVSVSEDNVLQYKNIGGYLVFKFYGEGVSVSSITLKGNDGEKLAGDASVTMPLDGIPTAVLAENAFTEITLTCTDPVQLGATEDECTQFWFVVPPVTFEKGFTVSVTGTSGSVFEKSTSKSIAIVRNIVSKMSPIEVLASSVSIPEAVDLGLPSGIKWASFNLGASKPEGCGDYFAWGETEVKSTYDWENYKYRISGYQPNDVMLSKYNTDPSRGVVDNKTILEPSDDIANVTLGGSWRLPTGNEYNELSNPENCDWEWTTLNGVNGYRITSKKAGFEGNSIFLPAAGIWDSLSPVEVGENGYYWCCVLSPLSVLFAEEMHFSSSHHLMNSSDRFRGLPVRPVYGETIPVSRITVSKSELDLEVGESEMLLARIFPDNASSKHYIWTSSNESVAIVTKPDVIANGGIVKGLGEGTATITVSATDGSEASASCTVTVLPVPETTNPLTFTSSGSSSISLTREGYPNSISLRYRINDNAWARYSVGEIIALNDGEQVSFRAGATGNYTLGESFDDFYRFSMTGSGTVAASGNIMSLLGPEESTAIYSPYCFSHLFDGCTQLTSAPELPATTLAESCYFDLFQGCPGLITAPELPATTLADYCYNGMFMDCTGLTTAPELPATVLAEGCYQSMFNGCTNLSAAPVLPATDLEIACYHGMFMNCAGLTTAPELPATSMRQFCYRLMFYGCTNLTVAPSLPATSLAGYCYDTMFGFCPSLTMAPALPATTLEGGCYSGMFYGCTGLTTAPELPATNLDTDCYSSMFSGCTGLTTAPALPSTYMFSRCYARMFFGCTGLTSAPKLPATTLAEYCYQGMFQDCTGLTTAPKLPATYMKSYCYSSMFSGCTSLTTAPELPSTHLAYECYGHMFSGCSGLTAAPELPSTTLYVYCYNYMFEGCSNLNYVKALFTTRPSESYTLYWLNGVSSSGTFVKNKDADWDVSGVHGIPSGWNILTE